MNSKIESLSIISLSGNDDDKKLEQRELKTQPLNTRLLAYVEQIFWQTGDLPSVAKTCQDLGAAESSIKKLWGSKDFQETLAVRGIKFRSDSSLLSSEQILVANVLLNTLDKTSIRTTLQALNVSQVKYNSWQNDPVYIDYIRKRSELMFQNSDIIAYKSLIQAAERGDMKAVTTILEMKGIYNPKLQVNVNVESILVRVVDVISRHVLDPEILEAIATDLDNLNDQDQAGSHQFRASVPIAISGGDSESSS